MTKFPKDLGKILFADENIAKLVKNDQLPKREDIHAFLSNNSVTLPKGICWLHIRQKVRNEIVKNQRNNKKAN